MLFRASFLSLLLVGPALAQTHHDVPLFCAGSGRLVSSEVTGTFPTHRYTVPGSASDDPAAIAVGRCGREITVDVQGHRLFLVPDAVGNGWSGTLRIDGFDTLYSFSRAGPRLLVGTWVTHAQGGRMDAEMRLVVVDGRAPDMEGCTDGAPEPLPARGTSFGRAALARALADRPLPDGADITDFVSPGWTDESGTERVHVLLSADGAILPRELPGLTADEICAGRSADVEPPTQMLNFKITRFDNNTNIYVQRIDIETGRILEQHEVISRGDDEDEVAVGLTRALDSLRTAPGPFATGR